MTIYYVDPINGSDANNALSWATAKQTITGLDSAIDQSPGDEIRIAKSYDPVSMAGTANCRWLGTPQPTATIVISTYAGNTMTTSTAHGFSNNDAVQITATSPTITGIWKIANVTSTTFDLVEAQFGGSGSVTSGTVRLANHPTLTDDPTTAGNIQVFACTSPTRTAFTASTNVTTSLNTSLWKVNRVGDSFAIGASFTTGKVAYYALPGSFDGTPYRTLNFWIMQTAGTLLSASNLNIRLCSDGTGTSSVGTFSIPAVSALSTWIPVAVTIAGVSGTVASVGVYLTTDQGAQTFIISNMFVTTGDSATTGFSLKSLIRKPGNNECFPIQGITGAPNSPGVIVLGSGTSTDGLASTRGYYGTTETVGMSYVNAFPSSVTLSNNNYSDSGSLGNPITISGGWNTTNNTQDGQSWYDCLGSSTAFALSGTYIKFDNINITRATASPSPFTSTSSTGTNQLYNSQMINSSGYPTTQVFGIYNNFKYQNNGGTVNVIDNLNSLKTFTDCKFNNNTSQGIGIGTTTAVRWVELTGCETCNNLSWGVAISGAANVKLLTHTSSYNASPNLLISGGSTPTGSITIEDYTSTTTSTTNQVQMSIINTQSVRIRDATITTNTQANGKIAVDIGAYTADIKIYNLTVNCPSTTAQNGMITMNQTAGEAVIDNFVITGTYTAGADIMSVSTPQNGAYDSPRLKISKMYGDLNDNRIYGDSYSIGSQTTTRHTASGVAWRFGATNAVAKRGTSAVLGDGYTSNPAKLSLAKIACSANSLVTVKAWFLRSSTTSTDYVTGQLFVPKDQISGVTTDQIATTSASLDTWEELTVTFTPTEIGIVEVFAYFYGINGSHYVYVDDVTITQA